MNIALDQLDKHYGITDRVIAGLDELGEDFYVYLQKRKRELQSFGEKALGSVLDYAIDSARRVAVKMGRHYLQKLTLPFSRGY